MQVQGQFTTAEVTHVLEGVRREAQAFIQLQRIQHLLGGSGEAVSALKDWDKNVTRKNLNELVDIVEQMGLNLPFAESPMERSKEIKQVIQGNNVQGVYKPSEALHEVKAIGTQLAQYYTVSIELATHSQVREAFRRGFENVQEQLPRLESALKGTQGYSPPPTVKNVEQIVPQGVTVQSFKQSLKKGGGGQKSAATTSSTS